MRLSSWRLARRAGRNGDSRARSAGHHLGAWDVAVRELLVCVEAADSGQAAALRYSVSTSAGVLHPSVLRGRPFNAAATAASSPGLWGGGGGAFGENLR